MGRPPDQGLNTMLRHVIFTGALLASASLHASAQAQQVSSTAPEAEVTFSGGYPGLGEVSVGWYTAAGHMFRLGLGASAPIAENTTRFVNLTGYWQHNLATSGAHRWFGEGGLGVHSSVVGSCATSDPPQCTPSHGGHVSAGTGYGLRWNSAEWRIQGYAMAAGWLKPEQYDAAKRAYSDFEAEIFGVGVGARTSLSLLW